VPGGRYEFSGTTLHFEVKGGELCKVRMLSPLFVAEVFEYG
jgi:hypothetical protein